jgi:hypothetical protein
MLRRVDADQGREIVGQKGRRNCAGVLFSYYLAGGGYPVSYRIRRDHPEFVAGDDGRLKPEGKYLGPPKSGNRIYLTPETTPDDLADPRLPLIVVEGEKKALALYRLARHESETRRFIVVGLPGVWNWRGVIAKATAAKGERVDVKGPIPDLNHIAWRAPGIRGSSHLLL